MTTITVDTRSFRLRLPVLRLGRLRGSIVVQVTEHLELRIEQHRRRRRSERRLRSTAEAIERVESHRTAALGHRLPF